MSVRLQESTGLIVDWRNQAEALFQTCGRSKRALEIMRSPDGSLFFQPGTQSIDIFDGRVGAFLERVGLPVPLSANYRALVSDNKDNVLVAITGTGNGIAVVDLNSLPEPEPLAWLAPDAAPLKQQRNTTNAAKSHLAKPLIHRRASPMLQKLLQNSQRLHGLSPAGIRQ
jgi:hypothetical protein